MKGEYSKLISWISLIIFIATLLFGFILMTYLIVSGSSNIYDFAIITTALSVTGGLFASTSKHYYQKAGLENTTKIRKSFYEEAMKIRLDYDDKILDIMEKHSVDKYKIDEIENEAKFRPWSDNILDNMDSKFCDYDLNDTEIERN